MKQYFVYLLASKRNGTIYVGMTNNLIKRIYEHKNSLLEGFTSKYSVSNLVYYQIFYNVEDAIVREKQIKKWKRVWKINLIEENNPEWRDLYASIL